MPTGTEACRATGAYGFEKNCTLQELRRVIKPVRLYANSFTVRDSRNGETWRIRFYEETIGASDGQRKRKGA